MEHQNLPTDRPSESYIPRVQIPPVAWFDGSCPTIVEMSSLWSRFSNPKNLLQSPDFLGDEAKFFFFTTDRWLPLWSSDEPRTFDGANCSFTRDRVIAAANFLFVRQRLSELATNIRAQTTPPSSAMPGIIRSATGHEIGADQSLATLEGQRRSAIDTLEPILTIFMETASAVGDDQGASEEKPAGYLGISLDDATRSMKRAGFARIVLFGRKNREWEIVRCLVKAGETGLTMPQRIAIDPHVTAVSWRQMKKPIKEAIAPLHLTVERGELWRLKDIPDK